MNIKQALVASLLLLSASEALAEKQQLLIESIDSQGNQQFQVADSYKSDKTGFPIAYIGAFSGKHLNANDIDILQLSFKEFAGNLVVKYKLSSNINGVKVQSGEQILESGSDTIHLVFPLNNNINLNVSTSAFSE